MGHRGLGWPPWKWDHNAFYHRRLLRRLPARLSRVLDVGCGSGLLTVRLAERSARVDAIDLDPVMVERAARAVPSARVWQADFIADRLSGPYDAVVSVAVLHHLPLRDALIRAERLLSPGGRLVCVGIPRWDLPRELPIEAVALVGQRVIALALLLLRRTTPGSWLAPRPDDAGMPTRWPPELTTRDVRRIAADVLPGSRVRRLVFWRYLLTWRKPG